MKHSQTQLADKSVYGNQTLVDRIDYEEKTFTGHGAEQRKTIGGKMGNGVAISSPSKANHASATG